MKTMCGENAVLAHDPRGCDVPGGVCRVEHEVAAGATVPCCGSDRCRFCQIAKRAARRDRREAKARAHRRDRREAARALRAGGEAEVQPLRPRIGRGAGK